MLSSAGKLLLLLRDLINAFTVFKTNAIELLLCHGRRLAAGPHHLCLKAPRYATMPTR